MPHKAPELDQAQLDQAGVRVRELAGTAVEQPARELDQAQLEQAGARVRELAGSTVERPAQDCPACVGSFRGLVRHLRLNAEAVGVWPPKCGKSLSARSTARRGSHHAS